VKIAHLSDLHITQTPVEIGAFFDRRISGALNLTLLGRGAKYARAAEVGAKAVQQIIEAKPDMVVFGGDATSLAEPSEFEGAVRVLAPLLDLGVPCIALPGNHDRYTVRAERSRRFEEAFADWQQPLDGWETITHQGYTVHFLDTVRANRGIWDSRGRRIEPPMASPRLVFAHYALLDRNAQGDTKWHALRGEAALRQRFKDGTGTTWCCGHLHHSFSARSGALVQFCAGSVGGPSGAWQMIHVDDEQIRREAWNTDGSRGMSRMRALEPIKVT